MQISVEELKRRLDSQKNLVNTLTLPKLNDDPNLPKIVEKVTPPETSKAILAGTLAGLGEKVVDIAPALDMEIPAIKRAQRTKSLVVALPRANTIDRVREMALERTLECLGLITEEKLEGAELKQLADVASKLSRVAANTVTKEKGGTTVNLVVYSPEPRQEASYRVLDI